jgi:hypothetical protein
MGDDTKAYDYVTRKVIIPHRVAFDGTIAYFEDLMDYAMVGPCFSESIRINLGRETNLFIWYFKLVFRRYAESRLQKPNEVYVGVYRVAYLTRDPNCWRDG